MNKRNHGLTVTLMSRTMARYSSRVSTDALFDAALTKQLKELVDRADRDPNIHAVVFTGTHPDRFLSHSDVTWLQQGGVGFPPINTRIAGIVSRNGETH
jgi:enoyl-CoA hydratase/carnithine racemase